MIVAGAFGLWLCDRPWIDELLIWVIRPAISKINQPIGTGAIWYPQIHNGMILFVLIMSSYDFALYFSKSPDTIRNSILLMWYDIVRSDHELS